jgi:hypothetical protein
LRLCADGPNEERSFVNSSNNLTLEIQNTSAMMQRKKLDLAALQLAFAG